MVAPSEAADLLLDACCVINLYATRHMERIIRALPQRFVLAQRVVPEAGYVLRGGSGENASEHEPIDLAPLIAGGLLRLLDFADDMEVATFVDLATQLDDGEAMTCAIALRRGCAVATDDRKVPRVLASGASHVPVYTTCQIIKQWADADRIDPALLNQVVIDVQQRARFVPGRHDPLQSWWLSALTAS